VSFRSHEADRGGTPWNTTRRCSDRPLIEVFLVPLPMRARAISGFSRSRCGTYQASPLVAQRPAAAEVTGPTWPDLGPTGLNMTPRNLIVKCGTHSGTKTGVWRPLWFATAGGPRRRFVRTPGACAGPGKRKAPCYSSASRPSVAPRSVRAAAGPQARGRLGCVCPPRSAPAAPGGPTTRAPCPRPATGPFAPPPSARDALLVECESEVPFQRPRE
jgi:hypothetical protein